MHKSAYTFGVLITSLVMLAIMPLFNNYVAMAQGYDNYGDSYSQYPTDDKKYECRTGPLEGFFTSSVEFCKHVKFDEDDDPYNNNNKNAPIVNVEKNLFVCNNATASPNNFECTTPAAFPYPAGLDSGEYMPCNDEICPFIDESDFSAQIFKDVAIIRGLSPEGTPVNLDKFHYMVTEGEIDKNTNDFCSAVGFDHANSFDKLINSTECFLWYMCQLCWRL